MNTSISDAISAMEHHCKLLPMHRSRQTTHDIERAIDINTILRYHEKGEQSSSDANNSLPLQKSNIEP
ncbi:MAG TPA: hypothetical protein ACN46Q_09235 [Prochlorococcus sp.]